MLIRIGHFDNFKGCNAILVAGDTVALQTLADALRQLETATAQPVKIHELPFVQCYGDIQLTAYPVSTDQGLRRSHEKRTHFSWHHSEEGWLEAAEKIKIVVNGSGCGHNYLDCIGVEDATVIVSLNEYDYAWWDRT